MKANLRIGTRQSPLALWQANWVRERLQQNHQDLNIELIHIQTQGDKILDTPLAKIGDKGLFTREIEHALIDGRIDLAVHSLKDLPTVLPDGLALGAVCPREVPYDALIAKEAKAIYGLPENATVATSSVRRKSQLLHIRPDLQIVDVRGNVGTRLQKFKDNGWDGMVMAYAGLKRLNLEHEISTNLTPSEMLPAVSQGAMGIEIRESDTDVLATIECVNDDITQQATTAERAFLNTLEGGCQVPVAGLAEIKNGKLTLKGLVASLDGKTCLRDEIEGDASNAASLGIQLAEKLINAGAKVIFGGDTKCLLTKTTASFIWSARVPATPGLMTLRGHQLICQAEVIVHDYLANPEILG